MYLIRELGARLSFLEGDSSLKETKFLRHLAKMGFFFVIQPGL
jgi:hypothetical protein